MKIFFFTFLLILPCLLEVQIFFLSSLPTAVPEPDTWRDDNHTIICVLSITTCFYTLQSKHSSVFGAFIFTSTQRHGRIRSEALCNCKTDHNLFKNKVGDKHFI